MTVVGHDVELWGRLRKLSGWKSVSIQANLVNACRAFELEAIDINLPVAEPPGNPILMRPEDPVQLYAGTDIVVSGVLEKVKIKESEIKTYVSDISITPLAIPMICGPGALTNSVIMMDDADSTLMKTVLIACILAVLALTYLILYSASHIIKFLGETGINVMMRLMGLIVMVIAVEFFFTGLKPIILDIAKSLPS